MDTSVPRILSKYRAPWAWLTQQIAGLLPPRCLVCGTRADGEPLCHGCRSDLPWARGTRCPVCAAHCSGPGPWGRCHLHPPAYDRCLAALSYEPPVDRLITALKFHNRLACGRLLARLLAERIESGSGIAGPDLLLPVPLHHTRLRRRGFNQALEIGRLLSRRLGIPLDAHSLWRQRATVAQSTLALRARQHNLRDAFALRRPLEADSVALIDDVMTSGSTAHAAANCLRNAGVKQIQVWVVARAG